jgi:predicted transcriptional regulator
MAVSVDGLENLFFNLSSESRLDILYAVSEERLRMNEIAKKVNITATEASRQIQRLSDESLIQKHTDGTYQLSNFGQLVLHFMPMFSFFVKNKAYFLDHDVWQIPPEFVSRLGELSEGVLVEELAEIVNRIENMMRSAEEYVYVITDQVMNVHSRVMEEQTSKGIKFRSIAHVKLVNPQAKKYQGDVETRFLESIPGLLVVTEKEGFFALISGDGRLSHSGFYGIDAALLGWINDMFAYYWGRAEKTPK